MAWIRLGVDTKSSAARAWAFAVRLTQSQREFLLNVEGSWSTGPFTFLSLHRQGIIEVNDEDATPRLTLFGATVEKEALRQRSIHWPRVSHISQAVQESLRRFLQAERDIEGWTPSLPAGVRLAQAMQFQRAGLVLVRLSHPCKCALGEYTAIPKSCDCSKVHPIGWRLSDRAERYLATFTE